MANYNSEFTGPQVDEAIQQVLDNYESWSNKADPEDVAVVAGAVTALQTAMNGKADLQAIAGAYRLRFSQVPMCFLSSVTAKSSYTGDSNNQIWYCTDGKLYYHANDTDYELGSPQYILYYCGNAIYKWGGSGQGFIKIVDLTDYFEDGRLKMSALPENLPTGGLSDELYSAIINNVETLRSILYSLIKTWLANLAYTNGRPSDSLLSSIASQFTWPANEGGSSGGDTPTPTNPTLSLPASGVNIFIGTNTGSGISKVVNIQGSNLTQQLNVVVSGTGFALSADGLVTQTLITANAANNGTSVTVYYLGTNTNGESGSLTISSDGTGDDNINRTISISAIYSQQGGGDEPTPSQSIELVRRMYINQNGEMVEPTGNISSQFADSLCCLSVPIDVNFGSMITDATEWENARIVWTHGQLPMSNCYLALYRINQAARTIMGSTSSTTTELNSSNITGWANLLNSGTRAKQLTATFPCEPNGNGGYKVLDGCSVVLYDGNGHSWPLISASDLQNATWE